MKGKGGRILLGGLHRRCCLNKELSVLLAEDIILISICLSATLKGFASKIILSRSGNISTLNLIELLKGKAQTINKFLIYNSEEIACLEISE